MHAQIAWEPTLSVNVALQAQDVIDVLTGETDKNNLSSMVSKGGTTIASATYPAGWTVWDDSTGTANEWVLRAPCDGDATQYKYVKLRFYTTNNYFYIGSQLMEGWDAGTNTPTNACTEQPLNMTRHPLNSYNSSQLFDVWATNRRIAFRATHYSDTFFWPCMEFSRIHPCFEIGSGYLPAAQINGTGFSSTSTTIYNARVPRVINAGGGADLTNQDIRCTNSGCRPSTNISGEFDNMPDCAVYDNSSNVSYPIETILFERREVIGQVCGDSTGSGIFIGQGGVVVGMEDDTLHTLDTTDDYRCFWKSIDQITTHGNIRYFFPAE